MSGPSSTERAVLYLDDLIKFASYAILFLGERTDAELEDDLQAQLAIVRAIEVVGEAANNIPSEIRSMAPDIPWRDIVAMRNRLVHHYFGVRIDVVLNVVRNDLPALSKSVAQLRSILIESL